MLHPRWWQRPEPYLLPGTSKLGDLPRACHGWQVVTVLLANGLLLAGPREISYFKRRGCTRTTYGYVSWKTAKAGCHQRQPSPCWNLTQSQRKDNVSVRISAPPCPSCKDHRPYFLAQWAARKIRALYLHWQRLMSSMRVSSLQRRRWSLDFASFPIIGSLPWQSPQACTTLPGRYGVSGSVSRSSVLHFAPTSH